MATTTPFVKRMRTKGGTIYTFSSALEDIGLNINERNNVVKMSHYALLNIPDVDAPDNLQQNRFNVLAIPGAFQSFLNSGSVKDGRVIIAESFQNYALNLETNLLNRDDYNPSLQTTVSERVFWKWLKETGAIRWAPEDTSAGLYWKEETDTDSSIGYNSVVKCIGQISAGSVRTDSFGTYNETYVLTPTSFGQTPVYFKQVEDDNYKHGIEILSGLTNILGRESYTKPHPDALDMKAYYDLADSSTAVSTYNFWYDDSTGSYSSGWWWTPENLTTSVDRNYYIDTSTYITSGIYNIDLKYDGTNDVNFKRSKVDCISIEYDIDNLQTIFDDTTLTFDSLAIDYAEDDEFDFNAILVYYSVYNKVLDAVLATNLLSVVFLDAPSGSTSGYPLNEIILPSITKLQSGPSGFGTSYSFRLNIKSDYMLDDTAAVINDQSTSDQLVLENWGDVFDNLNKTLTILNSQTGTLSYITEQYLDITANQTNILNLISDIQYQVNDIAVDITGTENTIALFADGDDPIVDSSIYMKNGNVGFFNNAPTWPVQIDASLKTKDIYLQTAIRDISGNILLGYGSPLQIGSSTGIREIELYTGKGTPALRIDTSNNVTFLGNVVFDASVTDASGGAIGNSGVSQTYIDGSLGLRDTSIAWLQDNMLEISDLDSYATNSSVNISLAQFIKSSSTGTGLYWNAGLLDVSVVGGSGVSQSYVDGSLASFIRSASTGTGLYWNAGVLDVSVSGSGVSQSYVDGSLATRDTSIAWLNSNKTDKNATISYKTSAYTLSSGDNGGVIEASGTFGIYLPTNLLIGFQALIMNVGSGSIAINASSGATVYTRDSSNDLTKRWTGATVYKRDSTTWVAVGDLN